MDKKIFFLFLLSTFLILADHFRFLEPFKEKAQIVTSPLKRQVYNLYLVFKKKTEWKIQNIEPIILQKKIEYLEQENALLRIEAEVLKRENEEARRLLQAPLPPEWQFLPTQVLGEKEGILQIGIGLKDKVEEGDVVVIGGQEKKRGGILIGRVIKVDVFISLVETPKASGAKISAKILPTSEKGIVGYLPEKGLVLDKVLQKASLEKEQMVVTSGEEGYPPNLLIGTIKEVEKNEVEVYQKAILEPLIDYQSLEIVFVVKRS